MVSIDTNYKNYGINTAQLFAPNFKSAKIAPVTNFATQNQPANYSKYDNFRAPVVKSDTIANKLDLMA